MPPAGIFFPGLSDSWRKKKKALSIIKSGHFFCNCTLTQNNLKTDKLNDNQYQQHVLCKKKNLLVAALSSVHTS